MCAIFLWSTEPDLVRGNSVPLSSRIKKHVCISCVFWLLRQELTSLHWSEFSKTILDEKLNNRGKVYLLCTLEVTKCRTIKPCKMKPLISGSFYSKLKKERNKKVRIRRIVSV